MSDKRESIEDIARRCWVAAKNRESVRRASEMAREMHPKSSEVRVGNAAEAMAKFREAYEFAEEFLRDYGTDWELHNKLCDMLKSALAAPPRQCDVGTSEDQLDRYGLFCQNKCPLCENRHSCHICGERYRMKCMMAWAQMPYEQEGDAK